MKLKYVSITGADDKVDVTDLNAVAAKYPFVEWAILLMPERMGQPRCPSAQWIESFKAYYQGTNTALHLCGDGLLGFIAGKPEILALMKGFGRIQLNLEFGEVDGKYDPKALLAQMKAHAEFEFIVQYTDKHKNLLPLLEDVPNHALLFDGSAGRGVLPDGGWPAPIAGHSCGYAGGLTPDNVRSNIEKIAKTGATETWIDMESGVRTDDKFDLSKVRRVLEQSAPFAGFTDKASALWKKRWTLTTLYMVLVYVLILGLFQYAKHTPITDDMPGPTGGLSHE
jgi:phosphoribosylanthranilate isomerase